MRSLLGTLAAVTLVAGVGFGAGLSGEWGSGLSFAGRITSFTNNFTLHLSFSGWELESTWDLAAPELNSQTLTFQGSLEVINYQAGLSFRLTSLEPSPLTGWAAEGLEWTGGFLTLELPLGNLTLRLTLITAPDGH